MRGGVEAYARQPSLRGNTLVFSSEAQLWVTELRDDGSPPPLAARLTSSVGPDWPEREPVAPPGGLRAS